MPPFDAIELVELMSGLMVAAVASIKAYLSYVERRDRDALKRGRFGPAEPRKKKRREFE